LGITETVILEQFPDPIPLPNAVDEARRFRKEQLLKSVTRGVSVRAVIIVFELIGYFYFSSQALLYDAIASTWDILSSLALMVSITLAARPPDEDHPLGHGRYEPFAGLQLSLIMIVLGGGMIFFQLTDMLDFESEGPISAYAWLIPFFAVLLLEISYRVLMRSAKKNHSPALEADAVHFRVDAANSLIAAIVLFVGAIYSGLAAYLDQIGAILIAALMIYLGFTAMRNNLHQVMDKMPEKKYFDMIKKTALSVPNVLGTEKIYIQMFGPDAHIDIDIEVDPDMQVDAAHRVSQEVRAEIQKEWPMVRDVTVHIEPYYEGDH